MKQLKIKQKTKSGFFQILLGTLAASIIGNALTGKKLVKAGERVISGGQNF